MCVYVYIVKYIYGEIDKSKGEGNVRGEESQSNGTEERKL